MTTVVPTPLPKIEVASLKAGDILVVTFPDRLSNEMFDHVRHNLSPLLPAGVKLMVLDQGVSVKVLSS